MADSKTAISEKNAVFSIKVSLKYPYVITYHINKNIVKIINIIHTSQNPVSRKATR